MSTSYAPDRLELTAIRGMPMVEPGDDLADLIGHALELNGLVLRDDDVLVLAQKIVSKAEGRLVRLCDVTPSEEARVRADAAGKDPRLVELILAESRRVVRERQGLLIVEHRLGLVMANAGIDQSNVPAGHALLLPDDPNGSAQALRGALRDLTGASIGVIVSDSIGRAWRNGTIGHSIGSAGILPVANLRGERDLFQRPLQSTEVALADEIAAAASLIMGQASEGKPVVLVHGLGPLHSRHTSEALLRPREQDVFR